jgi:hypothetical protein
MEPFDILCIIRSGNVSLLNIVRGYFPKMLPPFHLRYTIIAAIQSGNRDMINQIAEELKVFAKSKTFYWPDEVRDRLRSTWMDGSGYTGHPHIENDTVVATRSTDHPDLNDYISNDYGRILSHMEPSEVKSLREYATLVVARNLFDVAARQTMGETGEHIFETIVNLCMRDGIERGNESEEDVPSRGTSGDIKDTVMHTLLWSNNIYNQLALACRNIGGLASLRNYTFGKCLIGVSSSSSLLSSISPNCFFSFFLKQCYSWGRYSHDSLHHTHQVILSY